MEERQPEPAASVPHFQTFGPDPLTFDDPTIYHIRDLTDDLTEEDRKEILCVSTYPYTDLINMTAGKPPDRDFSSAKPTNQVATTTFNNWVEPFVRVLTEEDISFLRERTSRHDYRRAVRAKQHNRSPSPNVFAVPRRGSKTYKEVWAEEDNRMIIDGDITNLPPNEARGDMEQMNDDIAETDVVSLGPVTARLLQTMRPERRPTADGTNGTDGPNGVHGDGMDLDQGDHHTTASGDVQPSATQFAESTSTAWKTTLPAHISYKEHDDRILQELRHLGFLSENDPPDFDEHYDDEISARMRFLQGQLKEIAMRNGAKKRRVLALAQERMAQQEYNTISDDLDHQLNQAYLKRNRNSSKSKNPKNKRPGVAQAVGLATARPAQGIGEPIKGLMERKAKWTDWIGPVVGYGKSTIPEESIFTEDALKPYTEAELAAWEEDGDIEE
jgi:transcriptional adapter 3